MGGAGHLGGVVVSEEELDGGGLQVVAVAVGDDNDVGLWQL